MQRLPLFPLNTVLFPNMPISLHIFEERYKLMITRCIEQQSPFGVVLLQSGAEVEGLGQPAQPYTIGCTAQITQVQPLNMGRMNLVAVGRDRFRITEFDYSEPYLVGEVEMLPLANVNSEEAVASMSKLRPWLDKYLKALKETDDLDVDIDDFEADSLTLAYLSAALLKTPATSKQELLESETMQAFFANLQRMYRREVTLLQMLYSQPQIEMAGPFSLN